MKAKPFLKWAGGKTQLITDIEKILPKELISQNIDLTVKMDLRNYHKNVAE